MGSRVTILICLGMLIVGGITLSRIENVSAPIRMTDDPPPPPPKGLTEKDNKANATATIKDKTAVKGSSKAVKANQKQQVQKKSEAAVKAKAGAAAAAAEKKY